MKQYLRFFSGLAGIAILLTLPTIAQAAYIPIAYNGIFDESTDAPGGDIDTIGGTEDTALFQLIGTPEGFDNKFSGTLSLSNDTSDEIAAQIAPNHLLTAFVSIVQSGEFFAHMLYLPDPPISEGIFQLGIVTDLFPPGLEELSEYTITLRVETAPLSAIPLPAAFPLYGAGVALLGFMGWKRKRKLTRSEFTKEKAA